MPARAGPSDLAAFAVLCALYFPCEFAYLAAAAGLYASAFARVQNRPSAPPYDLRFALPAYLAYVPAWYYLCVRDFVHGRATAGTSVLRAALFALAVYGCYNFTTLVTLPGWPLRVALQDLAWGVSCLTAVTALLVYVIIPRM